MNRRWSARRLTRVLGFLLLMVAMATAVGVAGAQGASPQGPQATGSAAAQVGQEVAPAELSSILAPPLGTPVSGAAQGDVTIVDYYDYNCPVCREIEPTLRKVVARDPKVRLVHKDWPIFGDASVYAAYCSFAAARLGKYSQAHDALIGSKEDLDSKEDVRKVMAAAGFDMKAIDADIARHEKEYRAVLSRNQREAGAMGMQGTPGVIVGNRIVQGGGLDYAHLSRLVAQQRQGGAR